MNFSSPSPCVLLHPWILFFSLLETSKPPSSSPAPALITISCQHRHHQHLFSSSSFSFHFFSVLAAAIDAANQARNSHSSCGLAVNVFSVDCRGDLSRLAPPYGRRSCCFFPSGGQSSSLPRRHRQATAPSSSPSIFIFVTSSSSSRCLSRRPYCLRCCQWLSLPLSPSATFRRQCSIEGGDQLLLSPQSCSAPSPALLRAPSLLAWVYCPAVSWSLSPVDLPNAELLPPSFSVPTYRTTSVSNRNIN